MDLHQTITHRPLTREEAIRLHQDLKSTPNILGYTVRELLRLSDVYVAEVNDAFAGACWSVDLACGWTEIAVLYVFPEFRGEGIGCRLFDCAWSSARSRQRHLYILSRNPQVIQWMKERGMTVNGKLWCAPLAVQWYMTWYMTSWYRWCESIRKHRAIQQCPPLLQGSILYTTENPAGADNSK